MRFFLIALIFCSLFFMPAGVGAEEEQHNAHAFLSGPTVERIPREVREMALVWSTRDVVLHFNARADVEGVEAVARAVFYASEVSGIDPTILLAIGMIESGLRPKAIGDGGYACGWAQQHARFSMTWHDRRRRDGTERTRRQEECAKLLEPHYAASTLVQHLIGIQGRSRQSLERVAWRYRSGQLPQPDRKGVRWMRKFNFWRGTFASAFDRAIVRLPAR